MPESGSFEEMEAYHREHLEGFARRIVFSFGGTMEDAEDVYAESRFRALRGFVNFRLGDDSLKVFWSWRCRIIINTWCDELRRKRGHETVSMGSYFKDKVPNNSRIGFDIDELDLPDPNVNIEDQVSGKDERARFWENIESLLGNHKSVFCNALSCAI